MIPPRNVRGLLLLSLTFLVYFSPNFHHFFWSASVRGKIYLIRGQKVLLDEDLAELYGVETKRLNEQVRRNISRFPDDFMFQLNADEYAALRSQIATLKTRRAPEVSPLCVY